MKSNVIGDGPEYNTLVKRNDIERQIVLLGALPYEETMNYISCCDMVWSFNDSSNLTNTVQDALAIGKYVLKRRFTGKFYKTVSWNRSKQDFTGKFGKLP
jgi:hypothetical protein